MMSPDDYKLYVWTDRPVLVTHLDVIKEATVHTVGMDTKSRRLKLSPPSLNIETNLRPGQYLELTFYIKNPSFGRLCTFDGSLAGVYSHRCEERARHTATVWALQNSCSEMHAHTLRHDRCLHNKIRNSLLELASNL